MGKKGSWFSAIKRVFSSSSKEKPPEESEKKNAKEKKKQRGRQKHGQSKSFLPLFREPSSIEDILGEADQQKLFITPSTSSELPKMPTSYSAVRTSPQGSSPKTSSPRAAFFRPVSPKIASPRAAPRVVSPKAASPKAASQRFTSPKTSAPQIASPRSASPVAAQYHREVKNSFRIEPTARNLHLSATRIQAAYRGYMARRSFRALKGLVRLQGVVRGQSVKRQTVNAMKKMQLLVRVQTQIQLRRMQMAENQTLQRQSYRNIKDTESTLSAWTLNQMSEVGKNEDWDDSLLTKEEVDERHRKKAEAVLKRERARAYAYSHQALWKADPRSAQKALDFRSNGFPWWRNWLEHELPGAISSEIQAAGKNGQSTPQRPSSGHKQSPCIQASNYRQQGYALDNHESGTPKSSKSSMPFRAKQFQTPTRTPSWTPKGTGPMKYTRPRTGINGSPFDVPMNDTDSLTSCPPLSVPNYMAPTASAMAKARAHSNPKERGIGTPGNDSKRRFSFPLTPNIGSFKWSRGSKKDCESHKVLEEHQSMRSIEEVSIDSAVSMPAMMGRKPFNRFV